MIQVNIFRIEAAIFNLQLVLLFHKHEQFDNLN